METRTAATRRRQRVQINNECDTLYCSVGEETQARQRLFWTLKVLNLMTNLKRGTVSSSIPA